MKPKTFKHILGDMIQQQEEHRKHGKTYVIHVHINGGTCIAIGLVEDHAFKDIEGEKMCVILYTDIAGHERIFYTRAEDVFALVLIELAKVTNNPKTFI